MSGTGIAAHVAVCRPTESDKFCPRGQKPCPELSLPHSNLSGATRTRRDCLPPATRLLTFHLSPYITPLRPACPGRMADETIESEDISHTIQSNEGGCSVPFKVKSET